jgi:hypothetical protein
MDQVKYKNLIKNKNYKALTRAMIILYIAFMIVYTFRDALYGLDNQYITLFAWTAPNLIPSFLFTLFGIFYLVPILLNERESIKNPKYLLIVNFLNLIIFTIIELIHVIFDLAVWDNKDIIATFIGIALATLIYYKLRNFLITEDFK